MTAPDALQSVKMTPTESKVALSAPTSKKTFFSTISYNRLSTLTRLRSPAKQPIRHPVGAGDIGHQGVEQKQERKETEESAVRDLGSQAQSVLAIEPPEDVLEAPAQPRAEALETGSAAVPAYS